MQVWVLAGLAVLWAIVLLPDVLQRVRTPRSVDSIGSFRSHLQVLERATPVVSPLTGAGGRPSNVVPLVPRHRAPTGATFSAGGGASRPEALHPPVAPLQVASPGAVRPPHPSRTRPAPSQARVQVSQHRRRQDIIVGLAAAALLTFLAYLSFGGPFLALHLVVDVLLLTYVSLVLAVSRRERLDRTVTHLRPPTPQRRSVPAYAQVPRRAHGAR